MSDGQVDAVPSRFRAYVGGSICATDIEFFAVGPDAPLARRTLVSGVIMLADVGTRRR